MRTLRLLVVVIAVCGTAACDRRTINNSANANAEVNLTSPTVVVPPSGEFRMVFALSPETATVNKTTVTIEHDSDFDNCTADSVGGKFPQWSGKKKARDTETLVPNITGDFTLIFSCTSPDGRVTTRTAHLLVVSGDGNTNPPGGTTNPPGGTLAPTCVLSANFTSVPYGGGQVVLTVITTNATQISPTGGFASGTNLPLNGSVTVTVSQRTTYSYSATGAGGNCQGVVVIDVQSANAPTCTISVSSTNINSGNSVVITWSTTGATGNLNGSWTSSPLALAGSTTVTPTASTTYYIRATGPGGSCESTHVTVTVVSGPSCPLTIDYTPTGGNIGVNQVMALSVVNWPSNTNCQPFWYTNHPEYIQVNGADTTQIINGVPYYGGIHANIKGIFASNTDVSICAQTSITTNNTFKCYIWHAVSAIAPAFFHAPLDLKVKFDPSIQQTYIQH